MDGPLHTRLLQKLILAQKIENLGRRLLWMVPYLPVKDKALEKN